MFLNVNCLMCGLSLVVKHSLQEARVALPPLPMLLDWACGEHRLSGAYQPMLLPQGGS